MTLQTPAHGQRSNLLYPLHGLHGPVASLASNAGKHMLAMIEIDKIRQIMDFDPYDRALLLHRFFELFNRGRLLLQHEVAVHTIPSGEASFIRAGRLPLW